MRKGLHDKESIDKTIQAILKVPGIKGAVISDNDQVLCSKESKKFLSENCVTVVSAPLTNGGEIVGSLVLFVEHYGISKKTKESLVQGMAKLFSTQLELSKLDEQAKLLDQAEFKALQAQINPHFLFNCLSTISAICSEKPQRARELLVLLGDYFRRTLQSGDSLISLQAEMEYVNAYLQLEQARFEEKLKIKIDVPEDIQCNVPSFILQPLVENAVKHGLMARGIGGTVSIRAVDGNYGTSISILDDGVGMPSEIIKDLYEGRMNPNRIGLMNVHKRLINMYGAENGLKIKERAGGGTKITLFIPKEEFHANRSDR
ncbi:MAG: histidine kinase [Anaerovorax sp.]|nr:histidine kinase [Anaerovorax sp.]